MKTLEIGKQYRVREDLELGNHGYGISFQPKMALFKGKYVTIKHVNSEGRAELEELDDYRWTPKMFILEEEFEVGDYIECINNDKYAYILSGHRSTVLGFGPNKYIGWEKYMKLKGLEKYGFCYEPKDFKLIKEHNQRENSMKLENWREAEEKWFKIAQRTREKRGFETIGGWYDFLVCEPCGYCKEYKDGDCSKCPLIKERYCCSGGESGVFRDYITLMNPDISTDWEQALTLAQKMYKRILEDNPVMKKSVTKEKEAKIVFDKSKFYCFKSFGGIFILGGCGTKDGVGYSFFDITQTGWRHGEPSLDAQKLLDSKNEMMKEFDALGKMLEWINDNK